MRPDPLSLFDWLEDVAASFFIWVDECVISTLRSKLDIEESARRNDWATIALVVASWVVASFQVKMFFSVLMDHGGWAALAYTAPSAAMFAVAMLLRRRWEISLRVAVAIAIVWPLTLLLSPWIFFVRERIRRDRLEEEVREIMES